MPRKKKTDGLNELSGAVDMNPLSEEARLIERTGRQVTERITSELRENQLQMQNALLEQIRADMKTYIWPRCADADVATEAGFAHKADRVTHWQMATAAILSTVASCALTFFAVTHIKPIVIVRQAPAPVAVAVPDPAVTPNDPPMYKVKLSEGAPCWMRLTVNGSLVQEGIEKAPAEFTLSGERAEIKAGCPGRVQYEANGEPIAPVNQAHNPELIELVKLP